MKFNSLFFLRCSKEKLLTIAACIFENFGSSDGDDENGFNESSVFNEISEENGVNGDNGCRYVKKNRYKVYFILYNKNFISI